MSSVQFDIYRLLSCDLRGDRLLQDDHLLQAYQRVAPSILASMLPHSLATAVLVADHEDSTRIIHGFKGSDAPHQAIIPKIESLLISHYAEPDRFRDRPIVIVDHLNEGSIGDDLYCRYSVIVLAREQPGVEAGQAYFWFGFADTYSIGADLQERMVEVSESVMLWARDHGSLFRQAIEVRQNTLQLEHRLESLLGILHDIKSPVAAIRAIHSDPVKSPTIQDELSYLEQLISASILEPNLGLNFRSPEEMALSVVDQSVCVVAVAKVVVQRFNRLSGCVQFEQFPESALVNLPRLVVSRIISNLVDNGLKHSRYSTIVVGVVADDSNVSITVSDRGPGFPQDVAERMNSRTGGDKLSPMPRVAGGWGIGLLGSKKLLEEYGGGLSVTSRSGGGSAVTASFPATNPLSSGPIITSTKTNPGCDDVSVSKVSRLPVVRTVLVIDDDKDQAEGICSLFADRGVKAEPFLTVASAASYLSKSSGERCIVFCDATMPDGGVRSLLGRISTDGFECDVAVLSGDVSDRNEYQWAAMGAQAFFKKPAKIDELTAWINSRGRPILA